MIRRRSSLVLIACLLATACSDDPELTGSSGDSDAAPAVSAPATGPSSDEDDDEVAPATTPPADGPAFPANTARDEEQPSGGPLGVTSVRVAAQDGFDRVVFELAGREPGQPGWTVEYVEDPRQDGSGDPVEVRGGATLEVRISGVGYPMDTGVEEQPRDPQVPPGVELVQQVKAGSLFEGVFQGFVGVSREAPFRVFRLENPARVVVDVRHD